MGQGTGRNLILIGFSFTGKSAAGKEAAARLNWRFVDTDEEVSRVAGKPVPDIFAQDGEARFREIEREVLERVCGKTRTVVSTGGGAVLDERNRAAIRRGGVAIRLEATPETIHDRLRSEAERSSNPVVRPLLSGDDPLQRIRSLKAFRQPFYEAASDWAVSTDSLTLSQVCDRVVEAYRRGRNPARGKHSTASASESESPYCPEAGASFVVEAASQSYPVFVGWGILADLGRRMQQAGLSGAAHVIGDEQVFSIYGSRVKDALLGAGFQVDSMTVPAGEASKSLDRASGIYDWLVDIRAERGHAIVSLGGGMVGDLVGFVAATFLRGMPLIHAPTSLLAMVDAGIGGKTAVNHPRGKNLIGSFYQPKLVLMDVETLTTLPRRELASGWAEVVKHAMIADAALFRFLESNAELLLKLDKKLTTTAVLRSGAIKAGVVSRDEREQGERISLNFGHTIAHGLEAASDYERFLHGEAVAIGMVGESVISEKLGMLGGEEVERLRKLLLKFELPVGCAGVAVKDVMQAMKLDKKVKGSKLRWVLVPETGKYVVRDDVPADMVKDVLRGLGAK